MKNTILILLCTLTSVLYGQPGFTKYRLANLGTISIPSNMELQDGTYKKLNERMQKKIADEFGYEIAGDRIVFQQKGLNKLEEDAFSSYVRVIIETYHGEYGDFERLTADLSLTTAEENELGGYYRSQMIESFRGTGLKLIEWYGVTTVNVNGRTALKTSYLRQLNNNPRVIVNMYMFQNNDRMHQLIVSYRQSDQDKWKPLIEKVVDSFVITNVR